MSLLQRLKLAAHDERIAAITMLRLLIEAEDTKLYAKMAYPNLFKFCVKELSYSEGSAHRRIQAARLLREHESVAKKIEAGTLTITNAAQIQSAIYAARKEKLGLPVEALIEKASHLSTREAEKKIAEIAQDYGLKKKKEDDSLGEKLEAIRALFSHKNPNPTHHQLMHLMADEILGKEGDIEAPVKSPEKRHIPEKLKQAIFARDDHRCTFEADGRRCEGTHFLQIDHIIPIALGGKTEPKNLRTLCQTHNLLEAERHGLKRPCQKPPPATDSPLFH